MLSRWRDRQADGWMDGQTVNERKSDGWKNGWTDWWVDGIKPGLRDCCSQSNLINNSNSLNLAISTD